MTQLQLHFEPAEREIPLTRGMVTIVDEEDFARLSRRKWWAGKSCTVWYAKTTVQVDGKSVKLRMHRVILRITDPKIVIDHKNGNSLDNRKENLRIASRSQNQFNRGKQANNKTGFIGVSWDSAKRKYRAVIQANGKYIHLGHFDSALDAAKTRDNAARQFHGEFSRLNFQSSV